MEEQKRLAALGEQPAELVFKNARVADVYTERLVSADVAVCGDTIVGVGAYAGRREIDCAGRVLAPGFIDAHLHIESTMSTPFRLAQAVIPHGTTTLIADPHEVANVRGLDALWYFLHCADRLPVNMLVMAPSCVPATPLEDSGAVLSAEDLAQLLAHPKLLGLGEMMNLPGVLAGDQQVNAKLQLFAGRPMDGHAPMVSCKPLQAYRLAGIQTDHESTTADELEEKLRAGFFVWVREGSAARNLDTLVRAVLSRGLPTDRMGWCSDDKHMGDLLNEGHIDWNIRRSIQLGLPPFQAYRMATCNPAAAYGLSRLGAVAPGKRADLVLLDNFEQCSVAGVWSAGKQLYDGRAVLPLPEPPELPSSLYHTVRLPRLDAQALRLAAADAPQPVIGVIPGQIVTKRLMLRLPQKDGVFQPDGRLNKLVVVERHTGTRGIGVGAVSGLPLHGAIASTVAHDSHNLIVTGDNDADMIQAARQLERCGGGYALVQDGVLLGLLPLPICGLICDQEAAQLQAQLDQLHAAAVKMGVPKQMEPFTTLSFLALPVIPELKLTNRGYVSC